MKETTVSVFQKLLVIILAVLMFMTMVPVGLFNRGDKPSAEGSFVRYLPDLEVYATNGDKRTRQVSRYKSVYYKYNVADLLELDEDEIKEISLRLAFLKGSGEKNNSVYISTVMPESIPENPYGITFVKDNEEQIAKINPDTFGVDDCLFEGDLTDYVKAALKEGRTEIGVKISADNEVPILMASAEYLDVAYRPSLKVVTGIAEDTDADTLKKAELYEAVYVSEKEADETGKNLAERNGKIVIGDGNEAYIRFSINKNAIVGSLYSARILLSADEEEDLSTVRVYSINNDQWTKDSITYNQRPRGEEKTLNYAKIGNGYGVIDVTQQVCEAVNRGMYDITFRLVGADENSVSFWGKGDIKKEPRLVLKATDDKNIVCASEAALNALGDNTEIYVTMDLLNSYIAENDERARISWSEYAEDELSEDFPRYINEDGEIKRPKWFEDSVKTLVMAEIQAGDYITKRRYELTLPPEKKPDYTGYNFENGINIGNTESENKQKFEYINMSGIKRRWADGTIFAYRCPEKNSVMVLNLECSPYETNYLTLKLWRGDYPSPASINIKPYGYKGGGMNVQIPDFEGEEEGEILYLTYALPEDYTKGERSVSLCVSFDGFEDVPSRGIYGAFMTQNPYFEPKQFADLGEDMAKSFGDDTIDKFVDRFRRLFKLEDEKKPENTDDDSYVITEGKEKNTIVVANDELNIALKKNEDNKTVAIYHRTGYYDRYCADCDIERKDKASIISYGPYKIIINSDEKKDVSVGELNLELSGMYKSMSDDEYYGFSDGWQEEDDSIVPEDRVAKNGKGLIVQPEAAVILKQVAEPAFKGDWRVTGVNGRSVEGILFGEVEKIDVISLKAVGGVDAGLGRIKVICQIYEDGKLVATGIEETDVFEGIDRYNVSFGNKNMYMNKNRSIRIFVIKNGENMCEILPELEFPM